MRRSHRPPDPVGSLIRRLRETRGWTRAGMAFRIGYAMVTVAGWEAGAFRPKAAARQDLADLFGVPVDLFLPPDQRPERVHTAPEPSLPATAAGPLFRSREWIATRVGPHVVGAAYRSAWSVVEVGE